MNSESTILTVQIGGDAPERLDKALARQLPENAGVSRSRIARLIREGCVSRDGEAVFDPDASARPGDTWRISMKPTYGGQPEAEDLPLKIIFEDAELIVVDKAAGMVVHPGNGHPGGTLVNALLHRFGENFKGTGEPSRPGIVHRLDRDTTGLMVVAKTEQALFRISGQFSERSAGRCYQAVVRGTPTAGSTFAGYPQIGPEAEGWVRIEGNIARSRKNRLRMAVVATGGRSAVTRIRILEKLAGASVSLIECRLETGRTHQIRVHMERVGHPLIGDSLYGAGARMLPEAAGEAAREAAAQFPRQALHAVSLHFNHPASGERMRFESPLPDDMRRLVTILRSGAHT
ncbi:MAG: RluA family pseudouridine synthase [Rhodobacteraceae bacterium]|nr:RluA family pseudouridine synthase [Paracoccaceae bacterium]